MTGLGPLRTRLAGRGAARTDQVRRPRARDGRRCSARWNWRSEGHGQVVAAMGEPGVGKSRLFFEFKAIAQSGCLVLEAYSVSHGKASAYLPVIDLLREYFRIAGKTMRARGARRSPARCSTLDRALEDTLPYLFALLGIVEGDDPLAQMDAQIRRRRTLEAIKRILLRESLNQPLIVIFEDLHWIDARDPGAAQPAGRLDRQRAHPAAGELPARVPP